MSALAGCTVLVTRPAHQAAGLVMKLQDAGAAVRTLPLLAIAAPLDAEAARQALQANLDADLWLFTSANAVAGAAALHADGWPEGLLALGQGTVRALAKRGHRAIGPEGGSSEDLLLWPELAELAGKRVLIVTGESGRTLLADTLAQRGATVATACCYRRERLGYPRELVAEALAGCDVIVLTSGESLEALLALAMPTQTLLLPSRRVAAQARAAGVTVPILLPAAVSETAIATRLEQWRQRPHNDCP